MRADHAGDDVAGDLGEAQVDDFDLVAALLVESDRRKAVFLNEAIRLLSLPAAVICDRIESIAPQRADVLSARALASLDALCGFAALHLAPGGVAIFPKGANAPAERAEAARNWRFASSETPSKTDAGAVILCLKDIQHV